MIGLSFQDQRSPIPSFIRKSLKEFGLGLARFCRAHEAVGGSRWQASNLACYFLWPTAQNLHRIRLNPIRFQYCSRTRRTQSVKVPSLTEAMIMVVTIPS